MLPGLVCNTWLINRHLLTRMRADTGVHLVASHSSSLLRWLGQNLLSTLLRHVRWNTLSLLRSGVVMITLRISAPYSSTDSTLAYVAGVQRGRRRGVWARLNLPDLWMFWSLMNAILVCDSRLLMSPSVRQSLSSIEPRYTKDSTSSTSSPSIPMKSVHPVWFILSVMFLVTVIKYLNRILTDILIYVFS